MNWISRNIYMYILEHTHTNKEIHGVNGVVRVQAYSWL